MGRRRRALEKRLKREGHCVKALYDAFGDDDDLHNWRDKHPGEIVRVVLQAAEEWARLSSGDSSSDRAKREPTASAPSQESGPSPASACGEKAI